MVFWKIIPVKDILWGLISRKEIKWIGQKIMDDKKVARINELYHKSKSEGLTPEELKEQQILRKEYIDSFKRNLRGQLNNISIKEKDGSITNLGEKFGNKKGN